MISFIIKCLAKRDDQEKELASLVKEIHHDDELSKQLDNDLKKPLRIVVLIKNLNTLFANLLKK